MVLLEFRQALARRLLAAGEAFDSNADTCCDRLVWFSGPVLVSLGFTLTIALSFVGVMYILPARHALVGGNSTEEEGEAFDLLIKTVASVGVYNILCRYVYAVFTNPGTPTSLAFQRLLANRTKKEEKEEEVHPLLKWTTCRYTKLDKPPRCHYDSVHHQLVLAFDHACPWVWSSIGYNNYRHFVWLLVWVWLLTLMGTLVTVELVLGTFRSPSGSSWETNIMYVMELACCSAVNAASSLLLSWHLYLLVSGQTSVDFLVLRGRRRSRQEGGWGLGEDFDNPFDSGSALVNARLALLSAGVGRGWWEAVAPPKPNSLPLGKPFPGAEW